MKNKILIIFGLMLFCGMVSGDGYTSNPDDGDKIFFAQKGGRIIFSSYGGLEYTYYTNYVEIRNTLASSNPCWVHVPATGKYSVFWKVADNEGSCSVCGMKTTGSGLPSSYAYTCFPLTKKSVTDGYEYTADNVYTNGTWLEFTCLTQGGTSNTFLSSFIQLKDTGYTETYLDNENTIPLYMTDNNYWARIYYECGENSGLIEDTDKNDDISYTIFPCDISGQCQTWVSYYENDSWNDFLYTQKADLKIWYKTNPEYATMQIPYEIEQGDYESGKTYNFSFIVVGKEYQEIRWYLTNRQTGSETRIYPDGVDSRISIYMSDYMVGNSFEVRAEVVSMCGGISDIAFWRFNCVRSCTNTYIFMGLDENENEFYLYNGSFTAYLDGVKVYETNLSNTSEITENFECLTGYIFETRWDNGSVNCDYSYNWITNSVDEFMVLYSLCYIENLSFNITVKLLDENGVNWSNQTISMRDNQNNILQYGKTNNSGETTFHNIPSGEQRRFVFEKLGYKTEIRNIIITENTNITIQAEKETMLYPVIFKLVYRDTNEPITTGKTLKSPDWLTVYTNNLGECYFYLPPNQNFNFSFYIWIGNDYVKFAEYDIINLSESVYELIYFDSEIELFNLIFCVMDENDTAIENAKISFKGIDENNYFNKIFYTDNSGCELIKDVFTGNYSYTVSATGYQTRTGDIRIYSDNQRIQVRLEAVEGIYFDDYGLMSLVFMVIEMFTGQDLTKIGTPTALFTVLWVLLVPAMFILLACLVIASIKQTFK